MDPEDIQDRVNFVELDATSPDWPVHLPSLLLRFCWQYSPILNKLVVYPTSGCQVSDSSFDIVLMVQRLTTVLVCCNDSELSREVQLIPSADASLASFLPVLHQRLCARECHSATLQECVQGATGRCRNSGDDSKSLSFTHELCVFKTTEKLQPNRAASLLPMHDKNWFA